VAALAYAPEKHQYRTLVNRLTDLGAHFCSNSAELKHWQCFTTHPKVKLKAGFPEGCVSYLKRQCVPALLVQLWLYSGVTSRPRISRARIADISACL
jgi:hypothetical protein